MRTLPSFTPVVSLQNWLLISLSCNPLCGGMWLRIVPSPLTNICVFCSAALWDDAVTFVLDPASEHPDSAVRAAAATAAASAAPAAAPRAAEWAQKALCRLLQAAPPEPAAVRAAAAKALGAQAAGLFAAESPQAVAAPVIACLLVRSRSRGTSSCYLISSTEAFSPCQNFAASTRGVRNAFARPPPPQSVLSLAQSVAGDSSAQAKTSAWWALANLCDCAAAAGGAAAAVGPEAERRLAEAAAAAAGSEGDKARGFSIYLPPFCLFFVSLPSSAAAPSTLIRECLADSPSCNATQVRAHGARALGHLARAARFPPGGGAASSADWVPAAASALMSSLTCGARPLKLRAWFPVVTPRLSFGRMPLR